jgi:hypothetical protein
MSVYFFILAWFIMGWHDCKGTFGVLLSFQEKRELWGGQARDQSTSWGIIFSPSLLPLLSLSSPHPHFTQEVGLFGVADIPVSAFSGGEKRRLSVALGIFFLKKIIIHWLSAALAGNPKIVFLDEPVSSQVHPIMLYFYLVLLLLLYSCWTLNKTKLGNMKSFYIYFILCNFFNFIIIIQTTGMDPVSRHQVWEIIQKAKSGRVVILTTHSMCALFIFS